MTFAIRLTCSVVLKVSVVSQFLGLAYHSKQGPDCPGAPPGYPAEVGALFTTVSSIRVSRVGRVRVTLIVTVRVSRVSIMVSVRDSVK